MKHPIKNELAEVVEEISEVASWMRERTSDELRSFIERRYAFVTDEVLE